MPDPRSVMKEFRSLDQKRSAGGLTPEEEARFAQLRDLVGPELASAPRRGGFDVDAAAAQLRESLLPAGLRTGRPGPPPGPAPAAYVPPERSEDVLGPRYKAEPFAFLDTEPEPQADTAATTAAEPAWDAPYDPNAPGYDTGAAWDANAPPAAAGEAGGVPPETWDPNAPYDPNAAPPAEGSWDPNAAAYDPNAAPPAEGSWDPNAAAYDPNAAPPAAEGSWDPNAAAYDPNAAPPAAEAPQAGAEWETAAAQPVDGAAPAYAGSAFGEDVEAWQAAHPRGAAPAAEPAWSNAGGYDEDAGGVARVGYEAEASPDAGGQAYPPPDATAAPDADLLAEPGSAADVSVDLEGEQQPEGWIAQEPTGSGQAGTEGAGLESLLPFDPAAEAAIAPGEVPEGFGTTLGEYDDTAGFGGGEGPAEVAELAEEPLGAGEAPALAEPALEAEPMIEPQPAENWQPDAVLDEGFELASGGSFDATVDAAAPEWAGGSSTPPWEAGAEAAPVELATHEAPANAEPEVVVGADVFEEIAPLPGADLAPEAFAAAPEIGDALAGGAEAPPPVEAFAGEEAASPEPLAAAEPELAPPEEISFSEELSVDLPGPGEEAPPLDFGAPEGAALEEAAFVDAALGAQPDTSTVPEATFDVSVEAEPASPPEAVAAAVPPPEPEPEAAADDAEPISLAEAEEELPTLEGEDILEELPPEEQPVAEPTVALAPELPAAAEPELPPAVALEPEHEPEPAPAAITPPPEPEPEPAAIVAPPEPEPAAIVTPPEPEPEPEPAAFVEAPPQAFHVAGAHRVVVHTIEGQVKRGVLEDVDLAAAAIALAPQPGAAVESVASDHVKAIFFMLSPGEKPPPAEGKKVRVTFRDGRQVAGFSPDYSEAGVGFFMIPGDTRTNTGRIWVYRSAVRQVSIS